jgi:hypothetical protein
MSRRLRVLAYALWAGGAIIMAYLFYLHGTYAERMPHQPQPATGRTQHVYVMRSHRYVTEGEASRLRWATRIFPLVVFGFTVIAYLQHRQVRS